jgi:hypothetical protein
VAGAVPPSGGGGGGGNIDGELTAASSFGGGGGGRVMLLMRLDTLPVVAPDLDECGDGLDDFAAVGLVVALGLTST